jgi:hypothetical protein
MAEEIILMIIKRRLSMETKLMGQDNEEPPSPRSWQVDA